MSDGTWRPATRKESRLILNMNPAVRVSGNTAASNLLRITTGHTASREHGFEFHREKIFAFTFVYGVCETFSEQIVDCKNSWRVYVSDGVWLDKLTEYLRYIEKSRLAKESE